jgi:5'-phosphate synthase pdxT subunit|tara:strand:- start:97 stop:675 length:579 start_codon:yes stop_codon:yes gene_type:complete
MKIAVVGIQGDVAEHIEKLKQVLNELEIKGKVVWARNKEGLEEADGIIIPGGESTTIAKLMSVSRMDKVIENLANQDTPILGTCAGAILISNLGLINIEVDRNAYGRQKDSFESQISTSLGEMDGVFIRAPIIKKVQKEAKVFATNNKEIVGAEQGNILALTFHPELSEDTRIFQYFLKKAMKIKNPKVLKV